MKSPSVLDGVKSFSVDHNDFAFALYQQVHDRAGNLFLSPFSVRAALAMAHAGAKGETGAQMAKALRFTPTDTKQHAAFGELIQGLAATRGEYELTTANSLWGQEGAPVQREFLDRIARDYGGGMNLVDFSRNAEAARVAINRWVEDKTKERIRDLIPSGGVHADTRLVLVNAVYFKGTWALQFNKITTREETFHVEGGGKVRSPLMRRIMEVGHFHGEGLQMVELEYVGGNLSMLVLLPDKKGALVDLESKLTAEMLLECAVKMGRREVEVFLPRFTLRWGTFDLGPQLAGLGMPLAFTAAADFSGINGLEPGHDDSLLLSHVFHQTFVDVNEEGTEAAAATGAAMIRASMGRPPKPAVFRADHPFLFVIRDRRNGAILFLGRVTDPTRS
jgi:serpin B